MVDMPFLVCALSFAVAQIILASWL
jgi:hypothetical protein